MILRVSSEIKIWDITEWALSMILFCSFSGFHFCSRHFEFKE
jgi:hypothetical protein